MAVDCSLILLSISWLIVFSGGSTRSSPTSPDSVANTTDVEGDTRLDRTSVGRGLETIDDLHNSTYRFNTEIDKKIEKTSDHREGHETTNGTYDLKSPDDTREGKRTERILDKRESRETKRDRGIEQLDKMAEKPANDGVPNWTDSVDRTRDIELDRVLNQQFVIETNKEWHNRTVLDGVKRYRRPGGISGHRKNWYSWTGVDGTKRITKREVLSNRREVRETQNGRYESTLPDGFPHYYVPCSSFANFILLNAIRPEHMQFLQYTDTVARCLIDRLKRLDVLFISSCYMTLSRGIFIPRWLLHLLGFTVVCGMILSATVFTLFCCPCFVCWCMTFRRIVQAGKLDTYHNATWAAITVISCLSMLFALFGVITVGWAGIGISNYLRGENVTLTHTTTAYEEMQSMALDATNDQANKQLSEININVRPLSLVSAVRS